MLRLGRSPFMILVYATVIVVVILFFVFHLSTVAVNDTVQRVDRTGFLKNERWVVTCSNEVFEDTDDVFFLKFDSSDVVRQLKPGHAYRFYVHGMRVPLFSMYRNIIRFEEIADGR